MTNEMYNKKKETIASYIKQIINDREDSYLIINEKRVINKFIEEICNESKSKMTNCTERETQIYRTMLGLYSDGTKKSYMKVRDILNGGNIRAAVLNVNRKLMQAIYHDLLLEDKVFLIKLNYNYEDNNGMYLPENISIENLNSIAEFEEKSLQERNINDLYDLINCNTIAVKRMIKSPNTAKKEKSANDLIKAVHLLGYVFKDEEGFEKQIEEIKRLRLIINVEANCIINEEYKELKKDISYRNILVNLYHQYQDLDDNMPNIKRLEKEKSAIAEEIIELEAKIRTRKK